MPKKDYKILKYNHGEKSMKFLFIMYADLESVLEKHTLSGNSLLTYCSFDTAKNKLDYCRGRNCMKNFCVDLKEHATKITMKKKK